QNMANLRARKRCWGVLMAWARRGPSIPACIGSQRIKGFVLSKRALMLTVAAAALLSRPVLGDDFTDIKTKVTQQIKTSTAANGTPGNILIESSGSVVVAVAGPAVENDSANTVTNQGTISNVGISDAIGVRLDATAAGNG